MKMGWLRKVGWIWQKEGVLVMVEVGGIYSKYGGYERDVLVSGEGMIGGLGMVRVGVVMLVGVSW
jgi:hypothetical protein